MNKENFLLKIKTADKEKTLKIMALSDELQSIIADKDELTNGDYQSCIEAVIMQAIHYGETTCPACIAKETQ